MPRTRPTTKPLSYHRHTGQYYITRSGKRIYLGANLDEATERYHRLCLGPDILTSPGSVLTVFGPRFDVEAEGERGFGHGQVVGVELVAQ